jgi:hypothetical protein
VTGSYLLDVAIDGEEKMLGNFEYGFSRQVTRCLISTHVLHAAMLPRKC